MSDKENSEKNILQTNPFIDEMSEHTRRIRRNMMFVAVVGLLLTHGIKITELSLFGLRTDGVSPNFLLSLLLGLIFYNLVYFVWLALDHFSECRIRVTGTPLYGKGITTLDEQPEPSKNKQHSTLHSEWGRIIHGLAVDTGQALQEYKSALEKEIDILRTNGTSSEKVPAINEIFSGIESRIRVLAADEIMQRLKKFDTSFNMLKGGQTWRFVIMETFVPCILALCSILSIVLLLKDNWLYWLSSYSPSCTHPLTVPLCLIN